jgi:hypothetical protein
MAQKKAAGEVSPAAFLFLRYDAGSEIYIVGLMCHMIGTHHIFGTDQTSKFLVISFAELQIVESHFVRHANSLLMGWPIATPLM